MRKSSRCYLRGTSRLGLFNTVIGCLFNRVLVRRVNDQTKETVGWFWDKATKWPKAKREEQRRKGASGKLLYQRYRLV